MKPKRTLQERVLQSSALEVLTLLGASVVLSLFFWPGHIDADAIRQIGEATSGIFNDWYAPILDWFWRGLFLIHLSPGFVLWVTIAVFLLAVYELLRIGLSGWPAVAVTLLIAVYPPVLGFLGSLQRETWFGASVLAAYALAARARRTTSRNRGIFALASLVAVWFALAARQDAILAVIPAVFVDGAILGNLLWPDARRQARFGHSAERRRRRLRLLTRVAISVLLLVVFVLSQRVLTYDVIGATRSFPEQQFLEFDLASLSLRSGRVLLPRSVFPSQDLKLLAEHYSPYTALPLITGPGYPVKGVFQGSIDRQLEHAWLNAVLKYPAGYLRARWEVWTREIAWSGNAFEPYHDGFDTNPWGYRASFPSLDRFALAYLGSFTNGPYLAGGPLHRVWVYLIVAPLVGWDLLRKKRSAQLHVVGWLCWGAVADYMAYFVLAAGQAFRYAWLLVGVTCIAVTLDVIERLRLRVESRALEISSVRDGASSDVG